MTELERGRDSSIAASDRHTSRADWHATSGDDVLAQLSSYPQGLSTAEAQRRLAEHGPNELTRQQCPSAWTVLIRQFTSPLIYGLLISAAVAFALGEIPDGSVVLGVIVLNAVIGFAQEHRAARRSRHWPSSYPSLRPFGGTASGRRRQPSISFPATWCP